MPDPTPVASPSPAPAAPARIAAYDPNGALVTIPPEQLPTAQAQGYVIAGKDAIEGPSVYEGARARGYGPGAALGLAAISPVLSVNEGALTGLTAGLGSAATRKIAGVVGPIAAKAVGGPNLTPEQAEAYYKEFGQGGAHPYLHGAGELAGIAEGAILAPQLAGTKLAGVGRGLGAIGEAGAAAGNAARSLTSGIAGSGALGRAAAAGAEFGARGALETGLYSGVKELSEEMLGKPELNAEKIFAAAADGAEGGAIFGGALGAGGSLVKSGVKGLAGIAKDVASKNADALQGLANEQRWRALNPTKAATMKAEARIPGGTKGVGETLGEYGITGNTIEEAAKGAGSIEAISGKLDDAVEQVGQKLGAMTDASTATIPYGKIRGALNEITAPLRKQAGFESVVNSLDAYGESLASKLVKEVTPGDAVGGMKALEGTPITIQDALFQRKALDQLVYREAKALDPNLRVGFLRDFRAKFEGIIVNGFDDAAKAAGDANAKANLLKLKLDYQRLAHAQETAEASTAAMMTNRNLSMSDYMSGGIGSNVGQAAGGLIAGGPGAWAGGMIGGGLGAAVNRFGRQRGNAIAAAVADRLAAYGGKARAIKSLGAEAVAAIEKEAEAVVVASESKATPGKLSSLEEAPSKEPVGKPSGWASREEAPVAPRIAEPEMPPAPKLAELEAAPVRGEAGPMPEMPMRKAPTAAAAPEGTFEERVNDAIHHLDKKGKHAGLIPVGELRAEFPELSRSEFDAGMRSLDDARSVKLQIATDPKALPKGLRAEVVKMPRQASGDLQTDQEFPWITAQKEPTGRPWTRASSAKGDEAAHLAAEDKYIADTEAWNAKDEALDEAHAGATAQWQSRKMAAEQAHSEAMSQWESEKAAISASHAAVLDKAAEFARAQAAIKRVDAQVGKAAEGLVLGESKNYRVPPSVKPLRERYETARAEVEHLEANQKAVIERAAIPAKHLPKTSEALTAGAARAMLFMTTSTPQPVNQMPVMGKALPARASDAAMAEFLQRYDTTRDPMATLRKFERGRITTVEAMTLKSVSPEVFRELQMKAQEIVINRQQKGDPLPFDARQRMHVLLGIMTDPSQDPKMMKALQSNLAPVGTEPNQQMPSAPSGTPVNMPDNTRTYERLEEG